MGPARRFHRGDFRSRTIHSRIRRSWSGRSGRAWRSRQTGWPLVFGSKRSQCLHTKIQSRKLALVQLQAWNHHGFETRLGQCDFINPELDIAQPEDSFRASEGFIVGARGVAQFELHTGNCPSLLVPHDSLQRHDVGRTMLRNLAIGCGLRGGFLGPRRDQRQQRKQAESNGPSQRESMRRPGPQEPVPASACQHP